MTTPRFLALGLLIIGYTADRSQAAPPPGPPWEVNYPTPAVRPASDAPSGDFAEGEVNANGGPVGVAVGMRAAIAKPKMGQEYELRYQLRVHTKKGEMGPLLGTKGFPDGVSYVLRTVKCEYDWIEFHETIDITRKELAGMMNLPAGKPDNDYTVFIRVETQLYDVTGKKYITPGRTPAAIIVVKVGPKGDVWSVQSLAGWLVERGRGWDEKKTMSQLADLDEYNAESNGVSVALYSVITSNSGDAIRAAYIAAVDAKKLSWRLNYSLKQALEALAKGPEGALKNAAQKKLAEAPR